MLRKIVDKVYDYFEQNPVLGYLALVVTMGVVTFLLTYMGL